MSRPSHDAFDLERFVSAQAAVIEQVRGELDAGHKRTHWMWFIFPQLRGLGHSATAQRYGISGAPEAQAYLQHPILGPRLVECTTLVNAVTGRSVHDIFGSPDDVKFRSSMTLFSQLPRASAEFQQALERYFGGVPDPRTLQLLKAR
ncbi:MAG TPA: DUF1810 domain-containing protein [Steroidobacteraceae bacterium]|nr:DUF1810 domain-containing protein [Steroidobacteraceae bacterium]